MDADRVRDADTDMVAGYRPVSTLAVAAALAGAASMLALVTPLLWMLPLAGATLSWAALIDVARREAPKAGRLAALAGLALSLGFGAQAVTTAATVEWLARRRAEEATRFWLDAVASGRLDDARSMCGPDAVSAIDRVAACGTGPLRVQAGGREATTGSRIVRAAVAACEFEVVLDFAAARRPGDTERVTVTRVSDLTPSAN